VSKRVSGKIRPVKKRGALFEGRHQALAKGQILPGKERLPEVEKTAKKGGEGDKDNSKKKGKDQAFGVAPGKKDIELKRDKSFSLRAFRPDWKKGKKVVPFPRVP